MKAENLFFSWYACSCSQILSSYLTGIYTSQLMHCPPSKGIITDVVIQSGNTVHY
ncbi:uncharacterized protein BYT42DRAFT_558449 [Radiomyces spectabilis]|uniref:uncharacterized protein n=1 Tax=Radiomyces spectabilis TaxID=64574 RepID=UPI00221EF9E9|nr:uncharacterized protein BYT42DRAFT_558449 [Radiomyces spectabilis]KAI8387971.1 hypothetical protein BYT42DRAFT_558449 [Radiomyces spectabilis]